MWIDTHAHLDADEFGAGRAAMLQRAAAAGVRCVVIPAVHPRNFSAVRELAHASGHAYALGVHPLFVDGLGEADLIHVRRAVEKALDDPHFVGLGEIGLDFWVPDVDRALQMWWCEGQLKLARDYRLPVLLHVRKAQDPLAAALRRHGWAQGPGGIAHAFNGSPQQARAYLDLGLRLGFGGTLSFARARNIRRLAAEVPESALVLETDSPDMAPQWALEGPNEPAHLPRIGAELAALRGWSPEQAARITSANALAALPRLAALLGRDAAGLESAADAPM